MVALPGWEAWLLEPLTDGSTHTHLLRDGRHSGSHSRMLTCQRLFCAAGGTDADRLAVVAQPGWEAWLLEPLTDGSTCVAAADVTSPSKPLQVRSRGKMLRPVCVCVRVCVGACVRVCVAQYACWAWQGPELDALLGLLCMLLCKLLCSLLCTQHAYSMLPNTWWGAGIHRGTACTLGMAGSRAGGAARHAAHAACVLRAQSGLWLALPRPCSLPCQVSTDL